MIKAIKTYKKRWVFSPAENENDKYHFYLLMGAYNSILKNFDKANEYLHMAELLPVSRFRLLHLIPQLEIALFTASIE